VTAHRSVPPEVLNLQTDASDPGISAWVAANAGSGKTHVLAQRVIRLLLGGCAPSRILCLTFTKAAAANMASRVFDTLAKWTTLDDGALDDAIVKIDGRRPDSKRRAHARRLFAEALETPGGLKVLTIHAFCTRLLHQFPFEADVAARFTVLEERAETELIDKLRLQVLMAAAETPESPIGRALATAITAAADQTFADVVREAIGKRDEVMGWVERAGSVEAAIAELSHALDLDEGGESAERIDAELLAGPHLPMSEWPSLMALLGEGAKSDQEHIARLAFAQSETGVARVEAYLDVFCTEKRERRKRTLTKVLTDKYPELAQRIMAEQDRVCALLERRRAVAVRDRTAALLTIVATVIARYRLEKERRGLVDYDDLIDKTLTLFSRVSAAWVLYKLDLGIDHVLIDEAQDTSAKQWEVVKALVAEFFAGEGARSDLKRTIFAVGDEKQSIFSFQGAAPHRFAEMRRYFERTHQDGDFGFVFREFKYSFRSAPIVLGAVDTVFARPQAYEGLTADPVQTVHQAIRDQAPGLVEIWPIIEPEEKTAIEGWDAPFDVTSETTPSVRLARRIAKAVTAWKASREIITDLNSGEPRPVKPGDILILVRQRGALFEAIIRALKVAGIPVAGADRLMLTEHIAVMDLIALADALLLEDDDLALATILKSPLFGWDELQLFEAAWNRKGTLRQALNARRGEPHVAEAVARLDRLREWARRDTPFSFYARVLGAEGGRARMLARLGPEAIDALDEFLNLALDYETRETPSLQGFTAWLRASPTQIKRDMEAGRDEVRVMTVHGAKGLEAPVVILADTTTRPSGPREPRLLTLPGDNSAPGTPGRLVWAGAKATDVPPVSAARDEARRGAENEHRRLLYVAMTRAADRLIICGAQGQRARPEGCWYDLVHHALVPHALEVPAVDGEGTVWRLHKAPEGQEPAAASTAERAPIVLPAWLRQDAPPEAAPIVINPSAGLELEPAVTARGGDARRRAMARGTLIHRLMQSLPDIAPERRQAAARHYLVRAGGDFTEDEPERLAAQVLAVLDDPRFAPLAGPASRAEAAIVGRLVRPDGTSFAVAGQVDRLAVTPEAVMIADYKTNRPAPARLDDVPQAYLGQLALYRAVLANLYPDRPVRAALVWTDIPDFMEIPPHALDAALARVTAT
jgi:ATP-dependent helicase/nuclease subunit A